MTSDALYRDHLLDHWQSPRNWGELDNATHRAHHENPLCGDEIDVGIRMKNDRIADVRFSGRGCAVSIAAMSMLSELLIEKKSEEVRAMGNSTIVELLGVAPSPARMKCALLGLETVQRSLTRA